MQRELTGRTVFAITASAFAIIIAVNVVMAVQAVKTFPGLEVKSSYVASQTFQHDRDAQEALGWTLEHAYENGFLTLRFLDAAGGPADVRGVTALVGRATMSADDVTPVFTEAAGEFAAPVTLAPGRWMVLLDAEAADGTKYRKRFDLMVKG